ncbi:AraC family transcriptional regulator [Photobacterium salinisoli]|uniref:AraC family transcriptional regulator n=1 Tax=Photobacterium salinisoli TaxID=1616783 RepID=UPI000EA0FAAC|nr:helix-turn-helix transcriptional regulator [Photobacterium salinisoli]
MYFQSESIHGGLKALAYCYFHGDTEPPHSHTTAQLLHTLHGLLRIETEKGSWIVPPGRGLWIPAGMTHSLRANGTVQVKTLFIDPFARADLPNECQVLEVTPLLRELILAAINIPQDYPKGGKEERIVELILDELREISALDFYVPVPREDSGLKAICEKISSRLEHPWALTDAAKMLGISERSVSRKYHLHLGLSFGEWLRRQRLSRSLELLSSGLNVMDTSLAVGYDSPGAFSTMFKSRVGLSPTEYQLLSRD